MNRGGMSAPKSKRKTPWLLFLIGIILFLLGIIFSPLLLVLFLVLVVLYFVKAICLHIIIWSWWCARRRDILFVYSDSPIWHDYIEQNILPYLGNRAFVLNWSQRKRWHFSLTRMAFYHFGGEHREFIPLGVVFRPFRRTRTFRFGNHSKISNMVIQKRFKGWRRSFFGSLKFLGNLRNPPKVNKIWASEAPTRKYTREQIDAAALSAW
jgi:hypothetical protein